MTLQLQQLEAAFKAASAEEKRALLPALNAARREARATEAARVAALREQGLHPDGRPMTPNEKIFAAIFGGKE